jgi:capsular exopolysaccharide synthesis family protein
VKDLSSWHIRHRYNGATTQNPTPPDYTYLEESQDEVHLRDYWNIILKRKRLVALIFLSVAGLGIYIIFSATTLYTASAILKIEPQNPNVTGIGELLQGFRDVGPYDYYQTQFSLLRNRPQAARVIEELGLETNDVFRRVRVVTANPVKRVMGWVFGYVGMVSSVISNVLTPELETGSVPAKQPSESNAREKTAPLRPRMNHYLVGQYLSFLNIRHERGTQLVAVQFETPDPRLSEMLANAHAKNFLRASIESRMHLTKEAREYLLTKRNELQATLERSEEKLNRFRQAHGVVSLDKGENIVIDRLTDLNRQLTTARAQRLEAEALYRTVKDKKLHDLGEVVRQGLVPQLRSNLAILEAERTRLLTTFRSEHPRLRELSEQIVETRSAINSEIRKVVESIESNYVAAKAKEDTMAAEVKKQNERALSLKEVGVDFTLLQGEVNANRTLYENILRRLNETNVLDNTVFSNMEVVEWADTPRGPSGPNRPVLLLATLSVGLFLGLATALFVEYMDSKVDTPERVLNAVALGTIGVVPHLSSIEPKFLGTTARALLEMPKKLLEGPKGLLGSNHSDPAGELIISQSPISVMSEAYRSIKTSVLLSQAEKPPQAILITSPSPQEGKTVTVLNLGVALAEDGYSVLVMDADLRRGCCHSRLGLRNGRGLSNVLTGSQPLESEVQPSVVKGLSLLPRGSVPPNPAALLGSRKFAELLAGLRGTYDFILIDSPPVVPVTDASLVSVLCDGVLLVFHARRTTVGSGREAVQKLEVVRARILGVVLNAADFGSPAYAYHRNYYYSSYDREEPIENGHSQSERSEQVEAEWQYADNGDSKKETRAHHAVASSVGDILRSTATDEKSASGVVAHEVMESITKVFATAFGPLAPLVVRDQIAALGENPDNFHGNKLTDLLQALGGEISNEFLKTEFQHKVSEVLRRA